VKTPKRPSSTNGDYLVGYRRPPKATQFKPGQSGNPKGRPRGSRSVGAILQDVIQQKIAVTENGKTKRLSALEVMFRRLANDALRGDARAMKLLLSLVERYGESAEAALPLAELLAEDRAILETYLSELGGSAVEPAPSADSEGGDSHEL
jgi:hypothetical protein